MRAHTLAVFVTSGVLFGSVYFAGPASAQDVPARSAIQDVSAKPIGKIVTATGSVSVRHAGAVVVQAALGDQAGQPKLGDLVYLGDVVATGADGKVGITFTDGTAFDLSSNANMVMTEFVYDPNSKSNSTLLSLTKGSFTFVAGKIAKSGDMKIDTPVATMGIRGTTPRVEISDDGTVKFSTLIEEGKKKVLEKYGAATAGPDQHGGATGDADAVKGREKPNLNICRGC